MFYFHPYLGKISNLTNIFRRVEPPTSSVWLGKTLPSKDQWGCVVGDLHPESTYLNRYFCSNQKAQQTVIPPGK